MISVGVRFTFSLSIHVQDVLRKINVALIYILKTFSLALKQV